MFFFAKKKTAACQTSAETLANAFLSPSIFSGLVIWLLGFFEADAMLHDFEYSLPDKTYWRFTLANARFCVNAGLLAFQTYPLKLAVKVAALGVLLGVLCQVFGYSGYKTGTIPEEEK